LLSCFQNNYCSCAAVYGGVAKTEQFKLLRNGVEVVIATPGRLIDMIKAKACKMTRVTYLVLDEADRMFDMGFGTLC
jgi:ATP-dependent RNA helicase DDX42